MPAYLSLTSPSKNRASVLSMLTIVITSPQQDATVNHMAGALEFGRGPRRDLDRIVLQDKYVSRDHIRIEQQPNSLLRVENLSQGKPIRLPSGRDLPSGAAAAFPLPLDLFVGKTKIVVTADALEEISPADETFSTDDLLTIGAPALAQKMTGAAPRQGNLEELGEAPTPQRLTQWLETIIGLQHSTVGLPELFTQAATAVVDLVGLDLGVVVLKQDSHWNAVAGHAVDDGVSMRFSRTLVQHVAKERRTFYQDPNTVGAQAESLADAQAAVVSPIFGLQDDVIGVLYGTRGLTVTNLIPISALQAQVVQLLALAVSAAIARTTAVRTRFQFEQFFSAELVRELERNPALLKGRDQVVTVLVSDLRGFTRLSETLGASVSCSLIRDMIGRMTDRIVEQGGVIVDYAGDGILAMWNAPAEQPDHATRAARAALAMQAEMPRLNERWQKVVGGPLQLGIGINTGEAQVGNTGSPRRFKYGPHGHTVNVASRVQDATKKLARPVLVTPATAALLQGNFATRQAGQVALAGVQEEMALFALDCETTTM
jgi:adenylate cyclase